MTVEKLEDSIAQIKEMFKERATLIDNISSTPGTYDDDDNDEEEEEEDHEDDDDDEDDEYEYEY